MCAKRLHYNIVNLSNTPSSLNSCSCVPPSTVQLLPKSMHYDNTYIQCDIAVCIYQLMAANAFKMVKIRELYIGARTYLISRK